MTARYSYVVPLLLLTTACVSHVHTLEVGGLERTYRRAVGAHLSGAPGLLFALHGGGLNGNLMEACCHLDEVADAHDLVVVYPDAWKGNWNDGRVGPELAANAAGVDDIAFFRAIVDDVSREVAVDRGRIYATGVSNGGIMSFRLGCEASDLVVAIAPVVGAVAEGLTCTPAQPPAVLMINGTEDAFVPLAGGPVTDGKAGQTDAGRGAVRSNEESLALFRDAAGCTGDPDSETVDVVPDDETWLLKERYTQCTGGLEVHRTLVEGGGHQWPGARNSYEVLLGTASEELDASETVGDFLVQFQR